MINKKHKSSFTLVEVLVAVAIISFIGATLLKIVSNNTFFISNILQKKSFNSFISVFSEIDQDTKKDTFFIKDVVIAQHPSISDGLKTFLKDNKVKYLDQLVSIKSMLDGGDVGTDKKEDEDNQVDLQVEIRKKIIITNSSNDDLEKNLEYLYYLYEHSNK